MSIYEYDEEKHMRQEREENFQKGLQKGLKEGLQKGLHKGIQEERQQGISKLINTCRKLGVEREKVILQLTEEYSLSREETELYMERYWR